MLYWPFIGNPQGAALVAVVLAVCFVAARKLTITSRMTGPLLIATCLWLAYAIWEWYCTTGKFNIRVDLVFIPWILYTATVFGLVYLCFRKE